MKNKLYENILSLLLENISVDTVIDAIKNKKVLQITYDSDDNMGTGLRIIEPHAFGKTKGGNLAIRAFQLNGATKTYVPEWKIFLLTKILTYNEKGNFENTRPKYNEQGDKTFTATYNQI